MILTHFNLQFVALESQGLAILNGGFRVRGTSSFSAVGNTFQYVRSSTEESVSISGPLQQQITIQVNINNNYTLHVYVRIHTYIQYIQSHICI